MRNQNILLLFLPSLVLFICTVPRFPHVRRYMMFIRTSILVIREGGAVGINPLLELFNYPPPFPK